MIRFIVHAGHELTIRPYLSQWAGSLAEKIAIVRQEYVPAFGFTVLETVSMARTMYYGETGFETKADKDIVLKALEATDTAVFADRQLGQISGGERQRVFIARALAQETPFSLPLSLSASTYIMLLLPVQHPIFTLS